MMKQVLTVIAVVTLFACNNSKKDKPAVEDPAQQVVTDNSGTTGNPSVVPSSGSNSVVTVEGKDIGLNGSILVDKDKKNLKPGAPLRAMITSSSGPDNEGYILRFVFDTKPGAYPVTGISYNRGKDDNAQQFGGLLGGEEKIYNSVVNITECKDLGDNGLGGHKWSISGSVENITIAAMGLMLMDETKKHPKEIKIDKISFTGLSFDDNWEEMMEKAMDQLKKKNN